MQQQPNQNRIQTGVYLLKHFGPMIFPFGRCPVPVIYDGGGSPLNQLSPRAGLGI